MGKSHKSAADEQRAAHIQVTREQLLVGIILTLLTGVLVTILAMLPMHEGQTSIPIERVIYPKSVEAKAIYVAINPKTAKVKLNKYGYPKPILEGNNIRLHDIGYKSETINIKLEKGDRLEYTAIMETGEVLLFDWESDGDVHFDFFASLREDDSGYWTLYSEGDGRKEKGSIVAPYLGQHGWYWKNIDEKPVTIKLNVAGYYDKFIKKNMNTKKH
jgi:hypothetical protein